MTYSQEPLQRGHGPSIELHTSPHQEIAQGKDTYSTSVAQSPNQSSKAGAPDVEEVRQRPSSPVERHEIWNYPRINIARISVAFYGFVIMGANDAAYGVGTQCSLSCLLSLQVY